MIPTHVKTQGLPLQICLVHPYPLNNVKQLKTKDRDHQQSCTDKVFSSCSCARALNLMQLVFSCCCCRIGIVYMRLYIVL